jgi:hypothetical protein
LPPEEWPTIPIRSTGCWDGPVDQATLVPHERCPRQGWSWNRVCCFQGTSCKRPIQPAGTLLSMHLPANSERPRLREKQFVVVLNSWERRPVQRRQAGLIGRGSSLF